MKQKINLRLGCIALIAIALTSLGITIVYYNLFQTQVRSDLRQIARLLMETEVFQNAYNSSDGVNETDTSALSGLSSGEFRITWVAPDGTVLFDNDTDISGLANHLDRPEIQQALAEGEGESTRRSDTMNMNTFYCARLLEDGTVLRVSTQARTITSVFLTVLPVVVITALVILLICVLIGHYLTRRLLRPIEQMAEHLDDNSFPVVYRELQPFADTIRSQHEKILEAAKSRQDFTANVSHELKTPITAISGYAELIENHMADADSEAHIARQIRKNAERLLSLITDIIRLSELDHNELPRRFELTDLYRVAEESVNGLRTSADRRGITITCKGVSAGINADPALIREMIDNIVGNSIRYNRDGGSVDVAVGIETGHPYISVKDTGIGIPADQQNRVFERFYRVDKSRSRETGGTGLGLSIVKHIAQIHAARIELHSEEGVGTEMIVRF